MPKLPRSTSSARSSMASGTIPSRPAKPHPDRLKIMHLFPDRPLRSAGSARPYLAALESAFEITRRKAMLAQECGRGLADLATVHAMNDNRTREVKVAPPRRNGFRIAADRAGNDAVRFGIVLVSPHVDDEWTKAAAEQRFEF